ncbi:unnamed protein product [Clonostachys rosea f. rosea IK726]|uniref:Uncharacterized protein n=1 Tax=Clonostachys rosea f. rosea IK726 TaxID=1349383 RepID=A0ACA9U820_BIOOC|nr:unnamed protein product [Clonostachys rosea f. rosea IK726]
MFKLTTICTSAVLLATTVVAAEDDISFSACGLIGSYYPPPHIMKPYKTFSSINTTFTQVFDKLIQDGGSEKYGNITTNSTSFSVVIFSGAADLREDPTLFEYHYTSPIDLQETGTSLTSDTAFPVGDLTMVFTVYAWLVKMGESWDTPITKFLPELKALNSSSIASWDDITIGSLAGQVSGLARTYFVVGLSKEPFLFRSDTTPIVSYTAYQLLAYVMEKRSQGHSFSNVLKQAVFEPLGMTSSSLLGDKSNNQSIFVIGGLNMSQTGEPGAISLVSSISDLVRAGYAMLDSTLLNKAVTRRWLHGTYSTSNLRNGVGRPWEVYHSGSTAISPVLDALTKSGTIGQYASYFGLVPELEAGFAILAHDGTVADRKLDLNVHADIVSEALGYFLKAAAQETVVRYGGSYGAKDGNGAFGHFNITSNGYGLEVQELRDQNGVDLRKEYANILEIEEADLDFRLYPTNVQDKSRHQFVAVYQDRSAPIDMGTPTCITWQEVGAVSGIANRFWFELDGSGSAARVLLDQGDVVLERSE